MQKIQITKVFLLIQLLTIFSSCKKDVEITPLNLISLPEESEVFKIEEDGFFNDVFILDSFLIMTTVKNDHKIHVYNKNNLQLITKFGTDGMAPFELPQVLPVNNASFTQKADNILFYDIKVWQFKTINLNKFLLEGNVATCIFSSPMDKNLFYSFYLNILNENRFVAMSDPNAKKGMFYIYDTLKKEQIFIKHVPPKKVEDRYKYLLYYGHINANPYKNAIIFSSSHFDQVLFYNLEGKLQRQHIFSTLKMPELSKQFSGPVNESIRYTVRTYATSEYCFVFRLCQSTFKDWTSIITKPTQLLVFNWDGNLVQSFNLPMNRYDICYDEEFGYLYLIEDSDDEKSPHYIVKKLKICDYL